MNALDIYKVNLNLSSEFASLDALYQVFANSQEENWEKWWEYASQIPAIQSIKIERDMANFISKKTNADLFRPAVLKSSGLIIGNKIAFIYLFHTGAVDFFDFVD